MKLNQNLARRIFVIIGFALIVAGSCGAWYTYAQVARENITTPADAFLPNKPVRGPVTLIAQSSIIHTHALRMTHGKTYAEMDRNDPDRGIWVTANTLMTALNMAVLAYALSGLTILLGCILATSGSMIHGKNRGA